MSKKKKNKKRPIIVVEGAPEWMVTFGDLMSLLLTFFVLLFSVSEVKDNKIFDMVMAFRSEFDIESDADAPYLLDFSEVMQMLSQRADKVPDRATGTQGKSDRRVENPFGQFASITKIKDDFHITVEGGVLFERGSSEISDEGLMHLHEVGRRIRGGSNRIRIVGSAAPTGPDTDETLLAFQRARTVADILIRGEDQGTGLRPERLEIATRGVERPLRLEELMDPERLADRERVVVILTPEPVLELIEAKRAEAARDEEK